MEHNKFVAYILLICFLHNYSKNSDPCRYSTCNTRSLLSSVNFTSFKGSGRSSYSSNINYYRHEVHTKH